MSRTFRTNKYGEIKTDKFKRDFNGCGCVYCEFINTDFRNEHRETVANKEIREYSNYIEDRYDEYYDNLDDENYYLDTLSDYIMIDNSENITVAGFLQ